MFTDSGAFIVGSLLKKYLPYKLAPKVSPNKTIVGGVGGLVIGIVGSIITYYVYSAIAGALPNAWGSVEINITTMPAIVAFVLVGLLASILGQMGDLFESAIKRECNIKDMGKLLPGHGGVLDRFDGMLFVGLIVLLFFGLIV